MATPVLIEAVYAVGDTNPVSVNTSANVQIGDLLLVYDGRDFGSFPMTASMLSGTIGSGSWTQITTADNASGTDVHMQACRAFAVSAGVHTVTISNSSGGDVRSQVLVIRGADPVSPIDGFSSATSATNDSTQVAASVSPAGTDDLLTTGVFVHANAWMTSANGMTSTQADAGANFSSMWAWTQALSSSGATGTRTFNTFRSNDHGIPNAQTWNAIMVAVLGEGGGTVDGTAVSNLGALTGTATATVTVSGTANANLGALNATAIGSEPPATGNANLGALTGAASGLVSVGGTGTSNLGRLIAQFNSEPIDFVLEPLMLTALQCLCEATASLPNPPQHCCFRVGFEVAHDAGISQDLCCEGLAYVALGDIYPSSQGFPEADIIRQAQAKCPPPTWGVQIKMGIVRCIPVGGLEPLDCDSWNDAALQNIYDSLALRRASCCIRDYVVGNNSLLLGMSLVIERQSQTSPLGGCVERSVTISAQIPNCNC